MFFVRRIKDRLQKFHEAGNTPNIFGRPTPRPIDECRIICIRFAVVDFLENNVVTTKSKERSLAKKKETQHNRPALGDAKQGQVHS